MYVDLDGDGDRWTCRVLVGNKDFDFRRLQTLDYIKKAGEN
jgi:hypothetical protein